MPRAASYTTILYPSQAASEIRPADTTIPPITSNSSFSIMCPSTTGLEIMVLAGRGQGEHCFTFTLPAKHPPLYSS
jgi:hypothetical protein